MKVYQGLLALHSTQEGIEGADEVAWQRKAIELETQITGDNAELLIQETKSIQLEEQRTSARAQLEQILHGEGESTVRDFGFLHQGLHEWTKLESDLKDVLLMLDGLSEHPAHGTKRHRAPQ